MIMIMFHEKYKIYVDSDNLLLPVLMFGLFVFQRFLVVKGQKVLSKIPHSVRVI